MSKTSGDETKVKVDELDLAFLSANQVKLIDAALCAIGDFGEVRLIIQGNLNCLTI